MCVCRCVCTYIYIRMWYINTYISTGKKGRTCSALQAGKGHKTIHHNPVPTFGHPESYRVLGVSHHPWWAPPHDPPPARAHTRTPLRVRETHASMHVQCIPQDFLLLNSENKTKTVSRVPIPHRWVGCLPIDPMNFKKKLKKKMLELKTKKLGVWYYSP